MKAGRRPVTHFSVLEKHEGGGRVGCGKARGNSETPESLVCTSASASVSPTMKAVASGGRLRICPASSSAERRFLVGNILHGRLVQQSQGKRRSRRTAPRIMKTGSMPDRAEADVRGGEAEGHEQIRTLGLLGTMARHETGYGRMPPTCTVAFVHHTAVPHHAAAVVRIHAIGSHAYCIFGFEGATAVVLGHHIVRHHAAGFAHIEGVRPSALPVNSSRTTPRCSSARECRRRSPGRWPGTT